MSGRLALVHTSPLHVPVFEELRDRHHPGLELQHVVAPELLARARQEGPEAVSGAVAEQLRVAAGTGAGAVLCTCSTIGGVAEALSGAATGAPVLRLDRPMAAAAVRLGPRVTVLATVPSTLAPTLGLLAEEAAAADRPLTPTGRLVDGAWDRFEADDLDGYAASVAAAITATAAAGTADVIVLAQASMAPAADLVQVPVPVLSAPAPGLAAAAALVARKG
ncbi:aspartate/glutamate racemase family protein [Streptomyces sp. NPDC089919]|uniref:aspartate/glutamate racemase family protein n=1 Tax=Streptomyces sp. NPDC089919 TaxID=3155188 RepID=UPI00343333F1